MIGNRIEVRKGGFDFSNETAWQFGQMGQAGACQGEQKCLHINAWATRNWIGYTFYDTAWKTRLDKATAEFVNLWKTTPWSDK